MKGYQCTVHTCFFNMYIYTHISIPILLIFLSCYVCLIKYTDLVLLVMNQDRVVKRSNFCRIPIWHLDLEVIRSLG